MRNLNARLVRLEKHQPPPRGFTVWDWLRCPEDAPPGWELPAQWRVLLDELLPGPQADVYEEMIAQALAHVPSDEELAERLADLERQKANLMNGQQKGSHQ
jgi:hypothetical protein